MKCVLNLGRFSEEFIISSINGNKCVSFPNCTFEGMRLQQGVLYRVSHCGHYDYQFYISVSGY